MPAKELVEVPADLVDAAQKVWYAGLGALVLAQEHGGRLFTMLVEQGEEMEASGQSPVARVKDVGTGAEDGWKKVQSLVEAQVSAALHRLGVPTKADIATLTKRIEHLTASIEALKARG